MHRARTETESISIAKRAYSHRWLEERGLPSGLPDHLKPSVDRLYPRVVEGVGISVNFKSSFMAPAASEVRQAMSDAVEDAYADNRKEPVFVKARMAEAKAKTLKQLFG